MQKRKKQLLGLVGLALVVVVTIIAIAMPTPGASAADEQQPGGGGIGISVKVGPEETENPGEDDDNHQRKVPEVTVTTVNGESTTGDTMPTTVKRKISAELSYKWAYSGVTAVLKNAATGEIVAVKSCSGGYSGSCTVEFELDGDYLPSDIYNGDKFTVEAIAYNGDKSKSDEAVFIYRSAYIYSKGEVDEKTYEPYIYAEIGPDVKYAVVNVYDADGKFMFEQVVTAKAGASLEGSHKLLLQFKEHDLPAGRYTAILMAYSTATPTEDSLVSISTIKDIAYSPDGSPLPPNTGSNTFSSLNISQADYIVTGLIAFGLVTMFAIFLIVRRNKR